MQKLELAVEEKDNIDFEIDVDVEEIDALNIIDTDSNSINERVDDLQSNDKIYKDESNIILTENDKNKKNSGDMDLINKYKKKKKSVKMVNDDSKLK